MIPNRSSNFCKEREIILAKKRKKEISLVQRPIKKWAPVFILPTFAAFVIGFVWPFIQGIYLSFCNFNTPRDAEWIGFGNYIKVFKDAGFINAFKNTAFFAVVTIILINVLAFFIAYALTQKMRGANLFRTVFFMPNLIGGVVLGYIWSMIFDGILAKYGTYLTANGTYGFWGLVILVAWQQIGYMMIIYIAGLQAVPEDMLEAARIDGATGSQTLFQVIIPNVMPAITTCTFLTLTNSFKMFDQNMALTGGLPQVMVEGTKINITELLALNIYSTYNINKNWHGVAQAKAVIFFILVAVLAIAQQSLTTSKEVKQ
jgi:raffinose/stachyose/melibiose transport system permease protein